MLPLCTILLTVALGEMDLVMFFTVDAALLIVLDMLLVMLFMLKPHWPLGSTMLTGLYYGSADPYCPKLQEKVFSWISFQLSYQ
ncbi:hypothetical protein FDZ73_20820 [bacterium]|nr:MAG: hypothetical protein FDZ73_20820 [bacterium]